MASSAKLAIDIEFEPVVRRVRELAAQTGLTPVEVVEKAVLAFVSDESTDPAHTLVSKHGLFVASGSRLVTHEEVQASIDEDREARGTCY